MEEAPNAWRSPHRSPTVSVLIRIPAPGHFLVVDGRPAIIRDTVFLLSPATGHDAQTLDAQHLHLSG
jgi:hypothetical protein